MYIYILSIKYNNATQYNPSLFHTLHNTVYIYHNTMHYTT